MQLAKSGRMSAFQASQPDGSVPQISTPFHFLVLQQVLRPQLIAQNLGMQKHSIFNESGPRTRIVWQDASPRPSSQPEPEISKSDAQKLRRILSAIVERVERLMSMIGAPLLQRFGPRGASDPPTAHVADRFLFGAVRHLSEMADMCCHTMQQIDDHPERLNINERQLMKLSKRRIVLYRATYLAENVDRRAASHNQANGGQHNTAVSDRAADQFLMVSIWRSSNH